MRLVQGHVQLWAQQVQLHAWLKQWVYLPDASCVPAVHATTKLAEQTGEVAAKIANKKIRKLKILMKMIFITLW